MPASERQAWLARMWCAKEACAKALGRGFSPGIRTFAVRTLARESGVLQVQHTPAGAPRRELVAHTAAAGEWAVATCAVMTTEDVTT